MSNLLEIAGAVQRNLDDLGANFYSVNEDIIPSIQDGYNLIAALTESIESSITISFQAGKTFYDFSALIPNYLRIFGIFNNATNRWMYPATFIELYASRDDWEMASGEPFWFVPIDWKTVAFFPTTPTATGTMTVMFKATAPTLAANDTPEIPLEQQTALEFYATDDLLDQAQEWVKALEYAGMVEQGIEDIRKVLRNRTSPNHLYYKHNVK